MLVHPVLQFPFLQLLLRVQVQSKSSAFKASINLRSHTEIQIRVGQSKRNSRFMAFDSLVIPLLLLLLMVLFCAGSSNNVTFAIAPHHSVQLEWHGNNVKVMRRSGVEPPEHLLLLLLGLWSTTHHSIPPIKRPRRTLICESLERIN